MKYERVTIDNFNNYAAGKGCIYSKTFTWNHGQQKYFVYYDTSYSENNFCNGCGHFSCDHNCSFQLVDIDTVEKDISKYINKKNYEVNFTFLYKKQQNCWDLLQDIVNNLHENFKTCKDYTTYMETLKTIKKTI